MSSTRQSVSSKWTFIKDKGNKEGTVVNKEIYFRTVKNSLSKVTTMSAAYK